MQQILVYGDSLTWGLIPLTRERLPFHQRWPNVMEQQLNDAGQQVRVIEDALAGRRTVWDDPFKPGRNGQRGLAERIESHSPLALVILMLGANDFQSMHQNNAWLSAQGTAALVNTVRSAPIEPGMPVPPILIVAEPPLREPRGPLAPKFEGAQERCAGLADALRTVATELDCHFFDAGMVITVSDDDGVHLDAQGQSTLGRAMVDVVKPLL